MVAGSAASAYLLTSALNFCDWSHASVLCALLMCFVHYVLDSWILIGVPPHFGGFPWTGDRVSLNPAEKEALGLGPPSLVTTKSGNLNVSCGVAGRSPPNMVPGLPAKYWERSALSRIPHSSWWHTSG